MEPARPPHRTRHHRVDHRLPRRCHRRIPRRRLRLEPYQQGNSGDRAAALASIIEAVNIRRGLAEANPAAFLPDLAASLNNLSVQQGDGGDRAAALASITEAIQIRHQLAQANPAAFLPDLAGSLNNLSIEQCDAGDRVGALASITEAVDHYRRLAQANPAAFLPRLVTSLNNLSDVLGAVERSAEIADAWQSSVAALPSPGSRAFLRSVWSNRLAADGLIEDADRELRTAATEADHPPTDRADVIVVQRARQAIHVALQGCDNPTLPVWATAALPPVHIQFVNTYGRAQTWSEIETLLRNQRELVVSSGFRRTLTALSGLYLDNPVAARLAQLVDEITTASVDTVLAAQRADHERRELLDAWIATTTWGDSFAFLADHAAALNTDPTRSLLADSDAPIAAQHLAILNLAASETVDRVNAVVTDPDIAEQAALAALEAADLTQLHDITFAAARLTERPITSAVLSMVLLLATNQPDDALALAQQVAEHATEIQRRAHAIRLTALRQRRADLAGLDEVIAIIRPTSAETTR